MIFLKNPNNGNGILQTSHLTSTHTQFLRFAKQSVGIRIVNLDVKSEGYPTAFIVFAGREMICGYDLCSMQGPVHQRGVMGTGHSVFCVNIVNTYIYIYI